MSDWWYIDEGKRTGPVSRQQLGELIGLSALGPDTLVWCDGMEEWERIRDVEALRDVSSAVPPPPPNPTDEQVLRMAMAGPWRRFFARFFDISWEMFLVAMIAGVTLAMTIPGFEQWLNGLGHSYLVGLACMPFAFILDAIVYAIAGNTPGKALLRVKVADIRGLRLGFWRYLARNLYVWSMGVGFGIFLVSPVTQIIQYWRVLGGKRANYDEKRGDIVKARPAGAVRVSAFVTLFFALFMGQAVLKSGVLNQAMRRQGNPAARQYVRVEKNPPPADVQMWENPVSGKIAVISTAWKIRAKANKAGGKFYRFDDPRDGALFILAQESFPQFDLDGYVSALARYYSDKMRFSVEDGRHLTVAGNPAWAGPAVLNGHPGIRMDMLIIKQGHRFWRLASIVTNSRPATLARVKRLRSHLEGTIGDNGDAAN